MNIPKASSINQYSSCQNPYNLFNKHLFKESLPPCILTFPRKRNAYGFFVNNRWSNHQQNIIYEISLSPDSLELQIEEIMSILVHEMVHLWQYEFGKPCSGDYHNRQWGFKMKEIGLMPSKTGEPGGKEIGSPMSHYILKDGQFSQTFKQIPLEYLIAWKNYQLSKISIHTPMQEKSSRNKLKYFCPSCNLNVWGKLNLHIKCEDCQLKLKTCAN